MLSLLQAAIAARRRQDEPGGFSPDSVEFDGSAYLTRTTDPVGVADGKTGTFSCWLKPDVDNTTMKVLETGNERLEFEKTSGNGVQFRGESSFGSTRVQIASSTNAVPAGSWTHVMASWDLAASAAHLYIDGASDASSSTTSNNNIDQTGNTPWRIGSSHTGANIFDGKVLLPYFSLSYLDLSSSSNRAMLYNGTTLVDPATSGAPSPLILLKGDAASYGTNSGTGGDFTIVNNGGGLADGSDVPS